MLYQTSIELIGNLKNHNTLYTACLTMVGIKGGNIFCPSRKEAFKGSPLVAFWCSYENKIKPGFGATPHEKEAIKDYRL